VISEQLCGNTQDAGAAAAAAETPVPSRKPKSEGSGGGSKGRTGAGDDDTTNPLARHANQYKVSYKCVRCDLVMLYVPKIKFEEITKQKTLQESQGPTPEEVSSDDSFEKEGTSDEKETPWVETKTSRAAEELDMMRDSTKRPADKQVKRRTPRISPQGGDQPSGVSDARQDVVTFGVDVEYPKEDVNMMDYTWVVDQVKDVNTATDLYTKTLM
ncbi:unnamed protein product, partial [Prorocentrum cordatum]